MKKGLVIYTFIGIILVSAAGTLLHFAYKLSGSSYIAGLFSPVNESVWEHMKLTFFPMLLFTLITCYPMKRKYPRIGSALATGTIAGTLLIPVLFYTYSGILGFNLLYADIAVFLISVIFGFLIAYKIAAAANAPQALNIFGLAVFAMLVLFLIFTYNPPELALFRDMSSSELNQAENSVINYIEQLCVNIFRY